MDFCSPRIRVREVAQILGCSVSTVWAWVRKGLIPEPFRIGSRFSFWLRADIEALANPCQPQTQQDRGGFPC